MSTPDQLGDQTPITALSLKLARLPAVLSRSPKLEQVLALFSRPGRNFAGQVVLFLVMCAIVVPFAYYFAVRPSHPSADSSAASKLASIDSQDSQPVEPPPLPLPLSAISQIKNQESVPPVASATETTPAPQSTPSSDISKFASLNLQSFAAPAVTAPALPLSLGAPIQGITPPTGSANETTAALSPSTPSSEMKMPVPKPDAMRQPHVDDVAGRKRDQRPSKQVAVSSCAANILPENVHASGRTKVDQLGVQRICADPHLPVMGHLRCFVASIICPDGSAEKNGKVALKATATRRVP
jgi:hypothetical protein